MQRVYAACFFTQPELDEYLHRLEEAKRRDHRRLGTELDLFSIQEEAGPGLIFWHPKGGLVRKLMEDWLRDELLRRGYQLVYTPHIMRLELWKTSGHANFYRENMFGRDRSGERRLSAQAHELPGAHLDLQIAHAQLSRSAGAAGGTGHGLSLRALRRAARAFARARLHARRRAHFLHAQPDRSRGRGLHRFRFRGDEDVWVLALPGGAFGVGRGASGELRRLARGLGTLHAARSPRRSNACRFRSSAWRARRRFTGRRST